MERKGETEKGHEKENHANTNNVANIIYNDCCLIRDGKVIK